VIITLHQKATAVLRSNISLKEATVAKVAVDIVLMDLKKLI